MLIGDKYKVESDRNNLVLFYKQTPRDNIEIIDDEETDDAEKGWRILGYFYDFRELMKFLVDNEIKGDGLSDLKKVAEKQENLYELILTLQKISPSMIQLKQRKTATCVV